MCVYIYVYVYIEHKLPNSKDIVLFTVGFLNWHTVFSKFWLGEWMNESSASILYFNKLLLKTYVEAYC